MSKQEACETNVVEIPGSHVTDIWQMQTFLTIVTIAKEYSSNFTIFRTIFIC